MVCIAERPEVIETYPGARCGRSAHGPPSDPPPPREQQPNGIDRAAPCGAPGISPLYNEKNSASSAELVSSNLDVLQTLLWPPALSPPGPKARDGKPSARSADQRREPNHGGARRDRTDDLKLAKLALSQLSYGPNLVALPQSSRPTGRASSSPRSRAEGPFPSRAKGPRRQADRRKRRPGGTARAERGSAA